ncbi:MAG: FadR family transcriptional regulator [Phycisphaerae bacterium]|nr:FadR family transcriptional regulator [Phycisphaerae bacterium]
MSGRKTTRRRNIHSDLLAEKLRQDVIRRGYKPGDKISTETELAERYGVSRAKIREATSALCSRGILSRGPRVGTVVNPVDPEKIGRDLALSFHLADYELADALEARMMIEMVVLKLAIKRITVPQLQRMGELVVAMTLTGEDFAKMEELDLRFHLLLLEACGNKTLRFFGGILQELFQRSARNTYWNAQQDKQQAIQISIREHREIYEAVKNENAEQAEQLLRKHLKRLVLA